MNTTDRPFLLAKNEFKSISGLEIKQKSSMRPFMRLIKIRSCMPVRLTWTIHICLGLDLEGALLSLTIAVGNTFRSLLILDASRE